MSISNEVMYVHVQYYTQWVHADIVYHYTVPHVQLCKEYIASAQTYTLQTSLTKVPPCAAHSCPILVGGLLCRISTHSSVFGKTQVVVGAKVQAVGRRTRVTAKI